MGSIIIGYPGVGKSTLAGSNKYIDLESSMFRNSLGEKIEDWDYAYVRVAADLARQGYNVFISSHSDVYSHFSYNVAKSLESLDDIKVLAIYPSSRMFNIWVDKLGSRYRNDPSTKNLAAYTRAQNHIISDVEELKDFAKRNSIITIEIDSLDYSLSPMIISALKD